MTGDERENDLIRSVALQNASSILIARQRAEQELLEAKQALEKKTEELAQSLSMMRATLESTTDAILVTDEQGVITDFNENFVEMWRIPREIMDSRQHRLVRDAISQRFENPKQYDSRIDEIYSAAAPQASDVLELADGRVIERFSKVQSVEGRIVGRVWTFRDITEGRLTEKALIEADRRKDEFLSVLAHELRNPLAAVLMAVRLLQRKGPPDPALQNLRAIIVRQTLLLTKLVDDLLDVGRITTGKMRLEKKHVALNTNLKEAAEVCTLLIERRNHTLSVQFADPSLSLYVDAARIVQVVSNLLNNAAKYMNDGGQIELAASEEDGNAVIRVRDKGFGIPREMLDRIFQRFVQISTPGRSVDGLGIGLSVVKALVERHGGTVEAASEGLGKGSEFVVRLPVSVEPNE